MQIHDLDLIDGTRERRLLKGHVPTLSVWVPPSLKVHILDEMAP